MAGHSVILLVDRVPVPRWLGRLEMSNVHEVRVRHEDELLALPGVVGVADAIVDGLPLIQVLVSNDPDLSLIPGRIEGFPVEIVSTGEITAQE